MWAAPLVRNASCRFSPFVLLGWCSRSPFVVAGECTGSTGHWSEGASIVVFALLRYRHLRQEGSIAIARTLFGGISPVGLVQVHPMLFLTRPSLLGNFRST